MVRFGTHSPWVSEPTHYAVQVTDEILAKRAGCLLAGGSEGFLLLALAGAGYLAALTRVASSTSGRAKKQILISCLCNDGVHYAKG